MNILFICTGNTCRSPMAEGFLNKLLEEKNISSKAASAGIFAQEGDSATDEAIEAAKKYGVDISSHKASIITEDMLRYSDLILTMTESHKQLLYPIAGDKIHTLNEFAGLEGNIPDPFGGGADEYNKTAESIMNAVEKVVQKLEKGDCK